LCARQVGKRRATAAGNGTHPIRRSNCRDGAVMCYPAHAITRFARQFQQRALKGSHDTQDQRAYLRGLQWNRLPKGEAASAGNPKNLSDEVRGLCRQGKNYGVDQLTRS
jgi:hypothetical protein